MEKVQTPVVAGVSGAAVLAALFSFGGGGDARKAPAAPAPHAMQQTSSVETEKGSAPNQEGPWRAVCEEYAPNGVYAAAPMETHRGYKAIRLPADVPEETAEVTAQDAHGRTYKIAVHKQLIGDLVYCVPKPQLGGVHLIIATLPDPDKTEMRLEFDRYVDALEKGAGIQGYEFTGYWFPWSSRQTDPTPRKEDEVEAAMLRTEQPGILLFHNVQGERLFIFVVGETATSGVNRMQMVQALRYRQALIDASRDATPAYPNQDVPRVSPGPSGAKLDGPLMISGPHFSGTLSSIGEVLKESGFLNKGQGDTVKIVSPDAGSLPLINDFNARYCAAGSGCSFRSLSIPSADENWVVAAYLGRLGYKKEQIAELVEDQSGFGINERGFGANESNPDPNAKPLPPQAEPFGLVLAFPRELSSVESLSDQQSEQLAESGAKLLSFSKGPADVKLAHDEPIERDRPSIYASDTEASEISNALRSDMRVLRGNNIQCVVVSATNPLDRIFLLEYLHDQLPNVRTVAQEADELEISHPHFVDLTGTIVISSLPTVPEFAAAMGTKASSISFASAAAEEQFLSTAILLANEVMTRDISKKSNDAEDASANGDIREDGWRVSIAGENGFELVPPDTQSDAATNPAAPILVFGKEREKDGFKIDGGIALEAAETGNSPRFFVSFSMSIFGLTFIHLLMLWNATARREGTESLEKPGERALLPKFAYLEAGGERGFDRAFNLMALNDQLFLLNCMVLAVSPFANPFGGGPVGLRMVAGGAWMMVAIMLPVVVFSAWQFLLYVARYWRPAKQTEKLGLFFFSFLMITYLTSSVAFFLNWRSDAVREWRRILDLNDGLSPLVPIAAILLAWALWAALQLRRVKFIAHRKADLLTKDVAVPENPLVQSVVKDIETVHKEIERPTIGVLMVLFVLLFVSVIASWQWSTLRGIEPYSAWGKDDGHVFALIGHIFFPPSFEWWFGIWGGVMLLMTVVQTAYRLYQVWTHLSRLLLRLEPTRMKCAFARLGKDDRVHIKLWDLGKAEFRFDEMTLIIESLLRMGHPDEAKTAQTTLEKYQNCDLEGRQPTPEDRDELNASLNVCLAEALKQLPDKCAEKAREKETKGQESVCEALRSALCKDDERPFDRAGELDRYLALRLVTVIRYVLMQMRNFMWFIIYGYFLAVVSVTFYPFQGGKNLSDMLGVTFVIVLGIMAVLVTAVLQNPMLKRLEDGESNIASVLQACFHLLSVGGLPALALLAWQFPWVGQLAFSWLRPLLSAFR
jgi:hypothetical protein